MGGYAVKAIGAGSWLLLLVSHTSRHSEVRWLEEPLALGVSIVFGALGFATLFSVWTFDEKRPIETHGLQIRGDLLVRVAMFVGAVILIVLASYILMLIREFQT